MLCSIYFVIVTTMCTPNKKTKLSHLTPCRRMGLNRSPRNFTPPFKDKKVHVESPLVENTNNNEYKTPRKVISSRSKNKLVFEDKVAKGDSVSTEEDLVSNYAPEDNYVEATSSVGEDRLKDVPSVEVFNAHSDIKQVCRTPNEQNTLVQAQNDLINAINTQEDLKQSPSEHIELNSTISANLTDLESFFDAASSNTLPEASNGPKITEQDVTQSDLLKLKREIALKKRKLRELEGLVCADDVTAQIAIWKSATREILEDLLTSMKNENNDCRNVQIVNILKALNIPSELIGYDAVSEDFID
ncbi:uncharacterized protein LOC113389215 isoform X1 [Ctenocephalides felis]|uniref:uncharacterized protein LOC113389215 isoform X1 n=2 Tax=Ctenocephalides felis TaxID=7515 RepID=UPI000E6E1E31|nr:uncharacterized protein LOC113389215 isoform X1 [Ctenocephalides felis]